MLHLLINSYLTMKGMLHYCFQDLLVLHSQNPPRFIRLFLFHGLLKQQKVPSWEVCLYLLNSCKTTHERKPLELKLRN